MRKFFVSIVCFVLINSNMQAITLVMPLPATNHIRTVRQIYPPGLPLLVNYGAIPTDIPFVVITHHVSRSGASSPLQCIKDAVKAAGDCCRGGCEIGQGVGRMACPIRCVESNMIASGVVASWNSCSSDEQNSIACCAGILCCCIFAIS